LESSRLINFLIKALALNALLAFY